MKTYFHTTSSTIHKILLHPFCKSGVFVLSLLPFIFLFWGAYTNTLGANPAETLIHETGEWALRFLCLCLCITPLRQWTNWAALARFRRMLGLFSFFYAALHFLGYTWLDQEWLWPNIVHDALKRPFILLGCIALVLLLALALTSFNAAIKALGAPRWRRLHGLIYLIAPLVVWHFYWMRSSKNNTSEVLIYALIVALLLMSRLWSAARKKPSALPRPF